MEFKVDLLPGDPHPSKDLVQRFFPVGIVIFPKQKYTLVDLVQNIP